jgi:hypothetical protein
MAPPASSRPGQTKRRAVAPDTAFQRSKPNKQKDENVNSIHPTVAPLNYVNVSLPDFLQAVFGNDASRAWLAMAADGNDKAGFFGSRAARCDLNGPGWATANSYYSVGVLKDGATSRTNANWERTPVVVIDDVGEKCSADGVRDAFGEPSYIVQSSPGSEQWGYILRHPLTDAAQQARIMRSLTIAFFGGVDPGHEDLVRYVRLPCGVNNKPKRVAENGGTAPVVGLKSWNPDRRFDAVLDIAAALNGLPGLQGKTAWEEADGAHVRHSAGGVAGMPQTLPAAMAYAATDPVLAAFDKLGMVRGLQGSQGYVEVGCPWEYTHTKTDDRTGWNPVLASRGQKAFQCFHSDGGADQSNEGVAAALRDLLDARDGAGSYDALAAACDADRRASAKTVFGEVTADMEADMQRYAGKGMQALSAAVASATAAKPVQWRDFLAGAAISKRPARRTVCSYLARGEVTSLASQPGVGKSLFAIATAAAISADRPGLVGELAFARPGSTIYVSNEDPADIVDARREAWMLHHDLAAADFKHEGFVSLLDAPLRVVTRDDRHSPVKATSQLNDIAALIERERAAGRDVCLVMLDTATTVFENIEENDNGAQGAAYALLGAWARRHNVAVLILNHMPKATGRAGGGGDLGAIRGASAIGGSVRRALTMVELPDEEKDRLRDQSQRHEWVVLQGAKATNDKPGAMGKRYFRRCGRDVDAWDENGNKVVESVGLLEYVAGGPDFGFNPASGEALFRVCEVIARMDSDGEPLRVNVGGGTVGGTKRRKPKTLLADEIMDADDAGADRALKEAIRRGLVIEGDGVRSGSSPDFSNQPI